ncbi:serglycin [Astyanax mexicanus]|uniref:Serglycin n=2 Tax=Astyanax mexicanus TaxID=7994 RepID=A0A8B9RME0_ASTMX|nr:serglycin [Astyanax mexicanus]
MRFYQRIAFVLLLVYLFEDNVLGAPAQGRYNWVTCKPDSKNANCIQKQGPLIDISGASQRLPPSATKDIVPVERDEDTPETETEEQSGESSGDLDLAEKKQDWMDDGPVKMVRQVEDPFLEEASGEVDIENFVFPERKEPKLSPEDLKEDNMIQ